MQRLVATFGNRVKLYPLVESRRLHIGSGSDNDIVLPFPGVSRRHAALSRSPEAWILEDLGSKNGLLIDGRRHGRCPLEPQRTVQLGRAFVRLEEVAMSEAALALELPGEEPPRSLGGRGRSTDSLSSRSPAASALRFLRHHGESVPTEADRRVAYLAAARRLVGAAALAVVDFDRGVSPVVLDCSGNLLPGTLAAARTARPGGEAVGLAGRGGSLRRFQGRRGPGLLLRMPDGVVELEPWARDFLSFLAGQLGPGFAAPAGSGATDDPELAPPQGMLLGSSPPVRRLVERLRRAIGTGVNVLLCGETGTGKELFAQLIHRSGPTGPGPFRPINCAAIPEHLLEAELFGIEKGVATGVEPRPGLFAEADGGTLFLDEIAELPMALQPKILRAIQEREVLPLGASKPRSVAVRLLAATNRDLESEVAEGRFRHDLLYRLAHLRFEIPPLRDRPEDIPELVASFLRRAAEEHRRQVLGLSEAALERLQAYPWPGNVRQLQSVVEAAVLFCPHGGIVEARHLELPEAGDTQSGLPRGAQIPPSGGSEHDRSLASLPEQVADLERRLIRQALAEARGNKAAAARRLGISRPGLLRKIARLGPISEDG